MLATRSSSADPSRSAATPSGGVFVVRAGTARATAQERPGHAGCLTSRLSTKLDDLAQVPAPFLLKGQPRASVDQVLAVVEGKQQTADAQVLDQHGHHRVTGVSRSPSAASTAPGSSAASESGDRSTNQAASGNLRGGPNGQPRLAAAAGAGQRHQPPAGQQALHLGQLARAADEAGQVQRQRQVCSGGCRASWAVGTGPAGRAPQLNERLELLRIYVSERVPAGRQLPLPLPHN